MSPNILDLARTRAPAGSAITAGGQPLDRAAAIRPGVCSQGGTGEGAAELARQSPQRTITVAVRSDHAILRRGLEAMLDGRPDIVLVDCDAADGTADVVVFAPDAGRWSTMDLTAAAVPNWVLVIAPDCAPQELVAAMRGGVRGFVSLCASEDELLSAVGSVHRGAFYLSPGLAPGLHAALDRAGGTHLAPPVPRPAVPGQAPLTAREIATLRLVAQGLTHRQVGRRLSLTETTVDTYVKRIRAKLCVGNKAELTRKAVALGLVGLSADDYAQRESA